MRKYENPELEIIKLDVTDIITDMARQTPLQSLFSVLT